MRHLHVLPVHVWVFSRLIPQPKDMLLRWTDQSKLTIRESVGGCLSLCVGTAIGWPPIPGGPCLLPIDSSGRPQQTSATQCVDKQPQKMNVWVIFFQRPTNFKENGWTKDSCTMWLKGREITLGRYREAANQWRKVYRLFLPSQGTDPFLTGMVHPVQLHLCHSRTHPPTHNSPVRDLPVLVLSSSTC